MRRGRPRLPWKRGPAAWKIKSAASEIKIRLANEKWNFFGLRRAARILNVSTQPVRVWIRSGQLKRTGPRGRITKVELGRFIDFLVKRAVPFDPENYLQRLPPTYPFKKLRDARFVWPKGREALNPPELACLIGCHPSLIRKAILHYPNLGRWRTRCRWEITLWSWRDAFPGSIP
jgi:hypothetical protein